jgi:hypothetical protein
MLLGVISARANAALAEGSLGTYSCNTEVRLVRFIHCFALLTHCCFVSASSYWNLKGCLFHFSLFVSAALIDLFLEYLSQIRPTCPTIQVKGTTEAAVMAMDTALPLDLLPSYNTVATPEDIPGTILEVDDTLPRTTLLLLISTPTAFLSHRATLTTPNTLDQDPLLPPRLSSSATEHPKVILSSIPDVPVVARHFSSASTTLTKTASCEDVSTMYTMSQLSWWSATVIRERT